MDSCICFAPHLFGKSSRRHAGGVAPATIGSVERYRRKARSSLSLRDQVGTRVVQTRTPVCAIRLEAGSATQMPVTESTSCQTKIILVRVNLSYCTGPAIRASAANSVPILHHMACSACVDSLSHCRTRICGGSSCASYPPSRDGLRMKSY